MAAPTFSVGTGSETSCAWPTHTTGDIGLFICQYGAGTVSTPSGFTALAVNPVTTPEGLALFYKIATSSSEAAVVPTGGTNHMWGVMGLVTGAYNTSFLDNAAVTSRILGAAGDQASPGFYTSTADCLIVDILGWSVDNAGPIVTSAVNSSITGYAEVYDAGTTTGDGGGIWIGTGTVASAGYVTYSTITQSPTGSSLGVKLAFRSVAPAGGASSYSRSRVVNQ